MVSQGLSNSTPELLVLQVVRVQIKTLSSGVILGMKSLNKLLSKDRGFSLFRKFRRLECGSSS